MILRSHTKKQTTFMAIPEEVIHYCLLPRLCLNDILNLRATCHWTKSLCEGYLRTHPLSNETVDITLGVPDGSDLTLENFLHASTIPKPVSRFRLNLSGYCDAITNPHLPEFLKRYGPQVEDLQVSMLWLPLDRQEEFELFAALPKLKKLTVEECYNRGSYLKYQQLFYPTNFQNLTMIRLESTRDYYFSVNPAIPNGIFMYADLHYFWRLVKFCSNLECLYLPKVIWYEPLLLELQSILNLGRHKKFQELDLIHCSQKRQVNVFSKRNEHQLITEISDFSPDRKIKLLNVHAEYLTDFSGDQLRRIANQVVSIIYLNHAFSVNGIPLPNVQEIRHLVWSSLPVRFQRFDDTLTRTLFPGLRKLSITIIPNAPGQSLEILWREFRNLEEVSLKRDYPRINLANVEHCEEPQVVDDDLIFFGSVRARPAFLQLTELRVLTLEVGPNGMECLSNAVFSRILRHMGLRELHLQSDEPIISFTIAGIRALLTGRFHDTIEHFPFRGWSLANVRDKPFQRLAKKFSQPKS